MATDIKRNLTNIRSRITRAARAAGRDAKDIKLVAVSKTHRPKEMGEALNANVAAFGENKVQEAETKIPEVGGSAAEWHLIGHLQKNKVRKAVQLFHMIHTVDTPELAHRIDRICEEEGRAQIAVLVQVDLAGEETKSGVEETQLQMLVEVIKRCPRIRLDGLMVMPPYFEDPENSRPYFERLRLIRDRLASEGAFGGYGGDLSMGMSHDFEVAIEEGATILRIGTGIFGERGK